MTACTPVSGVAADALLQLTTEQWRARGGDLWIFGYASLIWRPEFTYAERCDARVFGWHRALKMWSRINRGSHEFPGLVFCLLSGGSCLGMAFRVDAHQAEAVLAQLWQREMPIPVYTPRWLPCHTDSGVVPGLSFTLPSASPSHTGELTGEELRRIFQRAQGRYGTTRDYAQSTVEGLRAVGIRDRRLELLLALASDKSDGGEPRLTVEAPLHKGGHPAD